MTAGRSLRRGRAARLRRLSVNGGAAIWLLSALTTAGCSSVLPLHVSTEPSGASVRLDDTPIGTSPLTYYWDPDVQPTFALTATRAGYLSETAVVTRSSPPADTGRVHLTLRENPAWRQTTTSEATNDWLRVQINEAFTSDEAWQRIVDSVTSTYDSLEQMDPKSGYIRSGERIRRWDFGPDRDALFVRTKFLCSISSLDPLIYKFKIASESREGSAALWTPYDRVFPADAELIEELTNRLGIK